jgi:cytochrome c-type biogenesis protein CcmH
MIPSIILGILTSVGTVLLLAPFLRQPPAHAEHDVAASLDAADHAASAARSSNRDGRPARSALAGIAILGAVAFYAAYGSLDLSDGGRSVVAAARQDDRDGAAAVAALAAATAQTPSQPLATRREDPQQRALGSVDEMVERLVARLKRNPNDAAGWRMLGWSYVNTERFDAAAAAYARAIELSPKTADLRSAYGEALVRAAGGTVTDQAGSAFREALRLDGKDARARFFIAMRKAQDGDKRSALDDWVAILNETDSKEPWFADLTRRVAELSRELNVDVPAGLPRRDAVASGGVLAALDQPRPADDAPRNNAESIVGGGQNASAPPANDRTAMIRGMVEGLAARLEQAPDDVDGWIKLIRSRKVLGESQKAEEALHRAMDVFKDAPEERARIVAIGQDMGLTQ